MAPTQEVGAQILHKSLVLTYSIQLEGNGGPPANQPVDSIAHPLVVLHLEVIHNCHHPSSSPIPLPQTPMMSDKLFKLDRFIIPSANPAIPFASGMAMVGFDAKKVLWQQAVVVPIGADGEKLLLKCLNFFLISTEA